MKRCYYIANSYDGKYFVLTDNVREYVERMAAYVMNLEKSGKCNHYSFGSVEMSASEYDSFRTDAQNQEEARIRQTQKEREERLQVEIQNEQKRHNPSIPLPNSNQTPPKAKRPNPGLRLV